MKKNSISNSISLILKPRFTQILAAISLLSVVACSTIAEKVIEKPAVALKSVQVTDASSKGATLVFGVQVENPNSFALKVDALQYDVEIGGKLVSSGQLESAAHVPANERAVVEIPVPVQFADLFSSALSFLQSGASQYRVKGSARFGLLSVPFDRSGELSFTKPGREDLSE